MRFVSYLVLTTLVCLCSTRAMGQAVEPGQKDGTAKESVIGKGIFADGTPLTQKRLDELLTAHRAWALTTSQKLEEECRKVKVQDRKTCARELLASDWGADQGRLVLKRVEIGGANLKGAYLVDANLERAYLGGANLKGAVLGGANLKGAVLGGANLKEADLGGANLEGAYLWGANLKGVLYEPKLEALPEIRSLRTAENLETMRFEESPLAMEDLRRELRKVGLKEQERQITCAIKRSEQRNARHRGELIEPLFNKVFFDLPVGYGLYPERALWILVFLIPGFALLYGVAIVKPSRNHGLYRLWPKERIDTTENGARVADAVKLARLNPRDWRRAPVYAVYFSVLSAFHIGWRELNVDNWISRLQFRTYTLQATGWVRTVSGLQSLISVYLLAMWALSYFGRPFE